MESLYPVYRIWVDAIPPDGQIKDAQASLEQFVSNMNSKDGPKDFIVKNRDKINVSGLTAEHIYYYYTGYTTSAISYDGEFASFVYGGYVFSIDVRFISTTGGTRIVFDQIIKTFKILD